MNQSAIILMERVIEQINEDHPLKEKAIGLMNQMKESMEEPDESLAMMKRFISNLRGHGESLNTTICWTWKGKVSGSGKPLIEDASSKYGYISASLWAWQEWGNKRPGARKTLDRIPECNNSRCVNPYHHHVRAQTDKEIKSRMNARKATGR